MTWSLVLAVLLAGAVMAVLRFAISSAAARRRSTSAATGFPVAVLAVNIVGSLIAGLAAGGAAVGLLPAEAETVALVGVAGGLTTFSTLNVETLQLLAARRIRTAFASVGTNYLAGVAAAAAGYGLVRLLG